MTEIIDLLKKYTDGKQNTEKVKMSVLQLNRVVKALKQEPSTDAVSKNDVIKMLNTMDRYVADKLRLCDTNKEFPSNEVFIVDDVYEGLDLLPPVTPTRPKGQWEFDEKGYFSCSECKRKPKDQTATTDFCPNCGADMREGE